MGAILLVLVGVKLWGVNQLSDQNPIISTSSPTPTEISTDTSLESMKLNSTKSTEAPFSKNIMLSPTESATTSQFYSVSQFPTISPISPIPTKSLSTSDNSSFYPPIASSTVIPTIAITELPALSTVNFFVMGGRFDGEDVTPLTNKLQSLPVMDCSTVLFHLGNWNSPYSTSCVEDSFIANVDIYSTSNIPVYFVPGDNEYNGILINE